MPDREHVAKIVAAYAKRNALAADQLPTLIATVHGALAGVKSGIVPEQADEPLTPAVSVRRSVQLDAIICLDCGRRQKMIKRHITAAHGLSVGEYRQRWVCHAITRWSHRTTMHAEANSQSRLDLESGEPRKALSG